LTQDFVKTDYRNLDSPVLDENRAACAGVIEAERCGPAVQAGIDRLDPMLGGKIACETVKGVLVGLKGQHAGKLAMHPVNKQANGVPIIGPPIHVNLVLSICQQAGRSVEI